MKKINILLFLFALIWTACEKDEDKMYALPIDQATSPSLTLEGITDIVVTEDNYNLIPAVLNWSRASFGKDIILEYILEMDVTEAYNTSEVLSLGKNIYSKALSNEYLSNLAINKFGGYDEDAKEVKEVFLNMRVKATIALENSSVTIPPDTVYSNSLSLKVLPYMKVPEYPETMYMIGNQFGQWDWNSTDVVEMIPVWGLEGHFWCIRYINAEDGFKWCAKRAWDGDFFSLGEEIGYTISDGNAFVAESGIYMVYMDMPNGKISVEAAKVYGMGDCFGGWDAGKYPFTVSGKEMVYTTTGSGELRIYAESNISPTGGDWWKKEFVVLNNKIEYRGKGDDQERANVAAGKTIILDFNTGTGKIE